MNLISHVDPMFFVGCKFEKKQTKNIWPCLPKRGGNETNKRGEHSSEGAGPLVRVLCLHWLWMSYMRTNKSTHTRVIQGGKTLRINSIQMIWKCLRYYPWLEITRYPWIESAQKPTGSILMTVDGFWAIYENIPRTASHWGSLHQEVHEDTRWVPSCP